MDQFQTKYDYDFVICGSQYGAQSFTTSDTRITKVELFAGLKGSSMNDMIVSIRDSPNGYDLTKIVVPANEISKHIDWVEFDFPDIDLIKDKSYYIVVRTQAESSYYSNYIWGCGHRTPYVNGLMLLSFNSGYSWMRVPFIDFCFRTYGIELE